LSKEFQYYLKDFNQFANNDSEVKKELSDIEEKLFGIHRKEMHEQRIADRAWVPLKVGIPGQKFLKNAPCHFLDAEEEEPLFPPQENILEECLRREAERVGYNENCINKIVYDSMEDKNGNLLVKETENFNSENEDKTPTLPSPTNCDNDADFPPWYQPTGEKDITLMFESRFESANLRKAI
jgi:hypothetical protein